MCQGSDVVITGALHDVVHGGVYPTPGTVSIRRKGAPQIILALAGETWNLGAPGKIREMTLAAVSGLCQLLAALDQCRVLVPAVDWGSNAEKWAARASIVLSSSLAA